MLIVIALVVIAVNATCDGPRGHLLVSERETECVPAFSCDTVGRALCGEPLLLWIVRAQGLFLFTWDLVARRHIIRSQFSNVLNIGTKRSCFPVSY